MLKRLLKIFLIATAAVVLLLILIGGLTQTRHFKNWLRDKIVSQAVAVLNGKLHLGRIEGNLVSDFGFRDICIELDSDTLLYVSNIDVALRPLELLQRQVLVTELILHTPLLRLKQRSDSTWNIAHLVKPGPPNTEPLSLDLWRIALQNLQINDGTLAFAPLDTSSPLLPRRIENLSTAMRLDYADQHLNVTLKNLRLTSIDPPLQLDSLTAQVFWGGDSLGVQNLRVRSEQSRFSGRIALRHLARPIFDIELVGLPFQLEDLRAFFPQCPVTGPVHGSLHALGDAQNLRATFHLAHRDGLADGNFFVLRDSAATYYNVDAAVRALHLNPYLRQTNGLTRLNFDLKLEGSGRSLDDLDARVTLNLDSSQVWGRELSQLRMTADAREKQIQTHLVARATSGELEVSGMLSDPLHEQVFALTADARHLNLAKLLENDTLDSDLSFHLTGSGRHFDNVKRKFDGWVRLAPSRVPAVLIDSAYCRLHVLGTDVQLDTLNVVSSLGNLQAGGTLSLRYNNKFRFRAELGDLAWIKRAVEADTLRAAGVFSGTATGPLDSLVIGSRFNLRRVQYNRTAIKRLTGNLTYHRNGSGGGGLIQLSGRDLMLAVVPVDSAKATVYYDLTRAQILANFWQGEKNTGVLEGFYTYGDIGRFDVTSFEVNVLGQNWRTPKSRTMWIDVGDDDYDFHDCQLSYGNQRFYLDGRLSYVGAEDLRFRLEGIDLAAIIAVLHHENSSGKNSVTGILDGQGHLTGTADKPILAGHLNWNNGRVADFVFEKWEADCGYEKELFSWKFNLHQNQDRFLTGDGFLPINLSFNNTGEIFYKTRPMRIQAATTGIDLAFLQTLTNRVKQVRGTLVFDVKLENTWRQPRSKGALRIVDGAFAVPQYGVTYSDVQLSMSLDTSFVKLVELRVRGDKGELKLGGQLNFTREAIGEATALLQARDFLVARNRNLELRLNANITGSGDAHGPRYRGDLIVERSRFFLQALQQGSVIELREAAKEPDAADSVQTTIVSSSDMTPLQRWLQKLRGEVKINIPRNTWIRGPELNAEIDGEVEFIQEGLEKYSLFGTLTLVRGTYELFGKRFDIEDGQITFQGDPENPQFDLTARHVFRAANGSGGGEKKNLEVKISGELSNPKIEFQQGGQALDEKDALANLIFGVNFEDLAYGEREDLPKEAAVGLVSGLVSQELAKSLGRSLNLDLIEFQSGESISKPASVLVGKYLTNDLFVSFSQEPDGRVVSLEWELLKYLFLQAAHGSEENRGKTGFDLIWKWDW